MTYRSTVSTPGLGGPSYASGPTNKNTSVAGYAGVSPLAFNSINSPTSLGSTLKSKEYLRRRSATSQSTGPAPISNRKNQSEPVTPIGPTTPASGITNKQTLPTSLSTVTETPLEGTDEQDDKSVGDKKPASKRVKRPKKMQHSASALGLSMHTTSPSMDGVIDPKQSRKISHTKPKKTSALPSTKGNRIARSAGTTPLTTEDILPGSSSSNDTGSNVFPASVATDPTPQTDFDPLVQSGPTLGASAYNFEEDDIFSIGSVILDKSSSSKAQTTVTATQRTQDELPIDEPFNLDFLDPTSSMNYNDLNHLNWQ